MKNKWKFFIASGAFALLLAGCGKESTNQKTQVSETAEQTFMMYKQQHMNEDSLGSGDLYIHKIGQKEDEKIASDVLEQNFHYNVEKDYVLYLSDDYDLYKVASGTSKEKLAKNVVTFEQLNNSDIIFYRDQDENLYSIDLGQKEVVTEKIGNGVSQYTLKDKQIYYVSKDQDLLVYNLETREEKTIAEQVNAFKFNGEEIFYTNEDNMLFYKENEDKEGVKITGDSVGLYMVEKDANDIYFVSNENEDNSLKVSDMKDQNRTSKIADDVIDYQVVDHETIYLTGDGDLFTTAKDRDTSKKLATDISNFSVHNGEVYMQDEDETLYVLKDEKQQKIASNVEESYISKTGEVAYLTKDHDLMVDHQKIESDVQSMANMNGTVAYATDENKLYYMNLGNIDDVKLVSDELNHYSTVSYLNKEIYRNTLSFKDIAGYWKATDSEEPSYVVIKENGDFSTMYSEKPIRLKIEKDSASFMNFVAVGKTSGEDLAADFTLEDDKLTIHYSSSEDGQKFERVAEASAKAAMKQYQQEQTAQEKREQEHELAIEEEEITNEMDQTVRSYLSEFSYAMNSGDTSSLSSYISPSSSFYKSQKQYIENSFDKGNGVNENNTTIVNHEKINDSKYHVSVDEDYTIYKEDGSSKDAVYTNVYTVERFDNGWYITGLNE
ncbi:TcaA NTF2-like domain-containing protein [Kurthia gibsonii]|uniref:TcaA NTF2-like domain-containing protein n=1 Tax=Kurthia gibsonii TaxID=33946 RepID=UPI00114258E6|nr:DUF5050 domain-containing protein [Kurthia gibsonii]GED20610.1 hypothetical protein KGI01_23510 [Kurthia gibsonii]